MVLERFLSWIAAAPAQARAEAAKALVAAYGRPDMDATRRDHLDRMVAALLDDPSVLVRWALSEAAADSRDVPRHLIAALSRDSAVALPVLAASQLLTPADLVEAIALGDDDAHLVLAARAALPAVAVTALAEGAGRAAVLTLCGNDDVDLTPADARQILARFGTDGAVRETLLQRNDLDPEIHDGLVAAAARALTAFAVSCGWMSERRADHVVRETTEKAAVTIALTCARDVSRLAIASYVTRLRRDGRLTSALLLRSLLSGKAALFEAALSQLADMPVERVRGVIQSPSSLAFASLYRKARLPAALLPAIRAAVSASQRKARSDDKPILQRAAVAHVQAACAEAADHPALTALLGRFEAEALQDDSRRRRQALAVVPTPVKDTSARVWMLPRRPVFRLPFRSAA